ncbi:DUF2147 domain-containing protein [Oryzifoliimicrobium ureilyticus]|uniref:DUF2147 domain-containing protein n=1 Tax=Oryzifoliimicrobium ureilyticus TaxID=3113724 RepID=UPI00307634F3
MKTIATIALTFATLAATGVSAADIQGRWARGDGKAKVAIAKCGADVCATNTWIKPGTTSEKVGDRLVMKIKPTDDSQYSGTAFDPQRNMTYKITVQVNGSEMTTKGCVLAGIVCKGVDWTRID